MRFRRFLESIESKADDYLARLQRYFPGKPDAFYQGHLRKIIELERQQGQAPDYNDPVFNRYIHDLSDELGHQAPASFKDKTPYGTAYPYYQHGAADPARETKNIWVKHSADPNNHDRILACQFAAKTLYTHKPNYADEYYEKLYAKRQGYEKPEDFWEVPYWVAVISRNLNNVDFYVVRDVNEAIQFFNQAKYKEVIFSVMDVVLPQVKRIAQSYPGAIAVGGYSTNLAEEFAPFKNVHVFNSMQDFILEQKHKKGGMEGGTDYNLFRGTAVIPRLCMSSGCRHKCKFCDVSRKLEEVPTETIEQEAKALSQLKSKLVYINDKTFGQANNYTLLPEIYWEIKKRNPNFQGFVVQTTASTMASKRLPNEFIKEAGIRFIELGIESYNDFILKSQKKPATEKSIDLAATKIRQIRQEGGNVWLIPNIIVGFPDETEETYRKTYNWLLENKDIISHLNIYSLAIYDDTELKNDIHVASDADRDENQIKKSFHTDPQVHERWHQRFIQLASQYLDKDLDIAQPPTSFSDYVKKRQAQQQQKPAGRVSLPLAAG
jgi:hypothetical protein